MTTRAFSRRNQHRAKALCWNSGGRKKVLVMLGYHSIQQMLSIQHDKSDFGRNSPLTERRTSPSNHLFTLHTAVHADHREAIPILHVKYRAQFLLGVGRGGMSYWVIVTLSCHNWKRIDIRFSGAYYICYCCVSHKCVLVSYSQHKKKTTFIAGMALVSLRFNLDFTSASSYGLGWYKYAVATQWYQFHTTDAWWFSLKTASIQMVTLVYACLLMFDYGDLT